MFSIKEYSESNGIFYLIDALGDNQPKFAITLDCLNKSFSLNIQSNTHKNLLKIIDIPKFNSDTLLVDALALVREQFINAWSKKKLYIEELTRIACVTEFNPVDFSFASLLIRLKYNKLFTLFLVNIRIAAVFPKHSPVLTIYDLQSSSIIMVESSEFAWNSSDAIEVLARKTVLFICNLMNSRAFPDRISKNSNGSSHRA